VDFSGNGTRGGIYVRWLIEPLNAETALQRWHDWQLWREVMKRLTVLLKPLGANGQAKDAARWLRVPGSINSKYIELGNGAPSFRDRLHANRIPLANLAVPLGIDTAAWPYAPKSLQQKVPRIIKPAREFKPRVIQPGARVFPTVHVRSALE